MRAKINIRKRGRNPLPMKGKMGGKKGNKFKMKKREGQPFNFIASEKNVTFKYTDRARERESEDIQVRKRGIGKKGKLLIL